MLMLTACQAKIRCPGDFIFDKPTNMCFKLYTKEKMTWEVAKRSCQNNELRRHLATVDTEERRKLIAQYLEKVSPEFGGEWAITHLNCTVLYSPDRNLSLSYTWRIIRSKLCDQNYVINLLHY